MYAKPRVYRLITPICDKSIVHDSNSRLVTIIGVRLQYARLHGSYKLGCQKTYRLVWHV